MIQFAPHPGAVTIVDHSRNTYREVPVDELPENGRFVYFVGEEMTDDPSEATERVPIIQVEMMALNERGDLVAPESAKTVRIYEYGPGRRLLRTTTMLRDGAS